MVQGASKKGRGGSKGPGKIELGPAKGEGPNWKVSGFPTPLPAYSLQKEQLS